MPTTEELKKLSRQKISENAPKLFFISTLYVTLVVVLGELQFRLPGTIDAWQQLLERLVAGEFFSLAMVLSNFRTGGLVLAVVIAIVTPVLTTGFMSYCLKINRNQDTDYTDIFEGFTLLFKIVAISIVITVIVILWSLLLIIPGIVAAYKYRQAYYILLDAPEKGVMQCIRESGLLMYGKKMELFLLDISFLGWIMLNSFIALISFVVFPVALPLISLFLTPYQGLARAAFYEKTVEEAVI
jgi:uncharacterized membrane protein